MRRNLTVLLTAFALATAAAACNGSEGTEAPAEPVATQTVTLNDTLYKPPDIMIRAGQTVTWVWDDGSVVHDVVSEGGSEEFKSKLQNSGTFTHTFSTPGRYSYYCTVHPNMRGTVKVT